MWKQEFTIEGLNTLSRNSITEHLGIQFTECGDDFLRATMPVDERTKQPMGILHGGASAVLAETLGSIGAFLCTEDAMTYDTLGIEISSSHLRSVSSGTVYGHCQPIHLGRTMHIWNIKMYDDDHRLCCDSKLTVLIRKKS